MDQNDRRRPSTTSTVRSGRELLALLEDTLGGPVSQPTAVALVPDRGGRHVEAFHALIDEVRLRGALDRVDGEWRLTLRPGGFATARSVVMHRYDLTRERLPDRDTVLDLLALAPGLRLDDVVHILSSIQATADPEHQLELLEEARVLDVRAASGEIRLRIADGIDELVIAMSIGPLRRRRIGAAIVATLADGATGFATANELIPLVEHGLDLGADLDAETLLAAARFSLRTAVTDRSLRFAEAAARSSDDVPAGLVLAAAEAQAGRADRAERRLTDLARRTGDDVQRAEAVSALTRHVRAFAIQSSAMPAADEVDRVDSASRRAALTGQMLYATGDPLGALAAVEPVIDSLTGIELAEGWQLLGAVRLIVGRLDSAADALDRAEAEYRTLGTDPSVILMLRAHVDALSGRGDDSIAALHAFRNAVAAFGQPVAQGLCSWAIGTVQCACGSLPEAIGELRVAAHTLDTAGVKRTHALVKLDLALALALLGETEQAAAALPWATPEAHGAGAGVSGKFWQVTGWIEAARGRRAAARTAFLRAADLHAGGGFILPSAAALLEAARVGGAAELGPRIRTATEGMDGTFVDVVRTFADALVRYEAEGDAAGQDDCTEIAREFDALGAHAAAIDQHILAAEAFDRAVELHRRAGDPRSATASTHRRDAQVALCGADSLPLLTADAVPRLSERERELASLAAAGHSNRQIAETLVLSVRTVETHLQRVYRKLGVRGRAELPRALDPTPRAERSDS